MITNRYFIAWIPEYRIIRKIQHLKEQLRDQFGLKKSLNADPHITLVKPFELPASGLPVLEKALHAFSLGQSPFELKIEGINSFGQHVLFIDVEHTHALPKLREALLVALQESSLFTEVTRDGQFHPHITLATKDLKPSLFYEVRNFVAQKPISEKCIVTNISLLQYQNKRWKSIHKFSFKKLLQKKDPDTHSKSTTRKTIEFPDNKLKNF